MKQIAKVGVIGVAAIAAAVWLAGDSAGISHVPAMRVAGAAQEIMLSTSTIPMAVAGMVVAADSVTVRAQVAGVLTSFTAKEGLVVRGGDRLAVQAQPVAVAQGVLASAQGDLTQLEQALAVEQADAARTQAGIRAYSAQDIARLRSSAGVARTGEATATVLTATEAGLVTTLAAIDYVQNNRSLFTADGMRVYEQVVDQLYGQIPAYFQSGSLRSYSGDTDIFAMLEAVRQKEDPTPLEVQNLAALTGVQLKALSLLFTTAEKDVFDRERQTEEGTNTYLATREAVVAALAALQQATPVLEISIDAMLQDNVSQEAAVAVSATDAALAETQATYAAALAEQSATVAAASAGVAHASASLGVSVAPFSGVVTETMVEQGAVVMPGEPLFTLVGSGARELSVTVPTYLISSVRVGQAFMVAEQVVGYVDRFSPFAVGGGATVIISLSDESLLVGESVAGHIVLDAAPLVYGVPRAYVQFDADGAFVTYQSGATERATVVYDSGDYLFIQVAAARQEAVVAQRGVTF